MEALDEQFGRAAEFDERLFNSDTSAMVMILMDHPAVTSTAETVALIGWLSAVSAFRRAAFSFVCPKATSNPFAPLGDQVRG